MADFLKNAFGGAKSGEPVAKKADSDFADFAGAPDPVPEAAPVAATLTGGTTPAATTVPWTKWYNVHQRHSLSEFKAEGIIVGIAFVIFLFHILGANANRRKAKKWMRAHAPAITSEFALVGYGGVPTVNGDVNPDSLIKEKSLFEFATYATGRQNTAFMDVKLTLSKKFNPIINGVETLFAFFVDSVTMPSDSVEAVIYPFDGKESLTVPSLPGSEELRTKDSKSSYDGFVWAIVNKERMQKLRDERYDVSITSTKDNSKLPIWLTVMSESAEVTDAFLTTELAKAVKTAGDLFDYLIISDQPSEKPRSLEETTPRKRVFLKYHLPSNSNYEALLPLFSYFLRIPDLLVQTAHFRPEVSRKIQKTRDAVTAQIRKALEDEKAEERSAEKEKLRKAKRDAELQAMDAKAQKKFLEKEKEKEFRKSQKKGSVRG